MMNVKISNDKKSGLYFTIMLLLFLILSVVASGVLLAVDADSFVVTIISSLVCPIAIIVTVFLLKEENERLVLPYVNRKVNPLGWLALLPIAVGMILGLGYVNVVFLDWLSRLGLATPIIQLPLDNLTNYLLCVFFIAVIPAVFEEYFFRGILLKKMLGYGKVFAVIISALFFAIYHGSISQLIYQFIYGVVLGYVAIKYQNVIYTALIHFLNNFFVLTLEFLGCNLFANPIYMILGLVLLAFGLVLVFFTGAKICFPKDKKAIDFFVPFGGLGIMLAVIIIVLGAFNG